MDENIWNERARRAPYISPVSPRLAAFRLTPTAGEVAQSLWHHSTRACISLARRPQESQQNVLVQDLSQIWPIHR